MNQYLVKLTISPETCPVWKKGFRPISPTNKTKMHIEVQHVCNMKIVEYIYIYIIDLSSQSVRSHPLTPGLFLVGGFAHDLQTAQKNALTTKFPNVYTRGRLELEHGLTIPFGLLAFSFPMCTVIPSIQNPKRVSLRKVLVSSGHHN